MHNKGSRCIYYILAFIDSAKDIEQLLIPINELKTACPLYIALLEALEANSKQENTIMTLARSIYNFLLVISKILVKARESMVVQKLVKYF